MSGGFPAPSDGSIPVSIINGVDQIRLAQWHFAMYSTKYLEEITRGVAYGTQDSRFTSSNLLNITLSNVESYAQQHIQCLQTLIANKNLLIASGTANAIVLATRVIDNSLEDGDYAKNAPLPLNFRDGLELDFVATANNTGAVTISIPNFQGVSGALNIVKQDLTPLISGDIKIGYRYTIICDKTNNRFILKDSFFREATTTTRGIVYANKPITLTYNSPTTLLYSAGTFQFDDGTGQGVVTAGSINFSGLANNTTYHIFAIFNPTTNVSAMHYDTSLTTPTLPSGFTKKRHIFSFITNNSGQIRPMIIDVDGWVTYQGSGISEGSNAFTNNGQSLQKQLTIPAGVRCEVKLSAFADEEKAFWIGDGTASSFNIASQIEGNFGIGAISVGERYNGNITTRTNTNREIRVSTWNYSGVVTANLSLYTQSYKIII